LAWFIFGALAGGAIVSHVMAKRVVERTRQLTAEWQNALDHVDARCEIQRNGGRTPCVLVTSDGKALLVCDDSQFGDGGVQ
jgi:hypothetical protein